MEEVLPARFGRYVLQERIGDGGMGVIYRATQQGIAGFEKTVAVKLILPNLIRASPEFAAQLIQEAKLSVLMSHPDIIQVYDLGEVNGQIYISMEYVPGGSVASMLSRRAQQQQPIPVEAAVGIVTHVCRGLHYAHELRDQQGQPLGIIHRDVSPSNVLVSELGLVKIIDFGIARAATNLQLTAPGHVRGKLAYLAPEQFNGAVIDRRVDVFATGIVLMELLLLRPLFGRGTDKETLQQMFYKRDVPRLSEARPDAPAALAAVVDRAMAYDPKDRFATAAEFADALSSTCSLLEGEALARALEIRARPLAKTVQEEGPHSNTTDENTDVFAPKVAHEAKQSSPSDVASAFAVTRPIATPPKAAPAPTSDAKARGRRWLVGAVSLVAVLCAGTVSAWFASRPPAAEQAPAHSSMQVKTQPKQDHPRDEPPKKKPATPASDEQAQPTASNPIPAAKVKASTSRGKVARAASDDKVKASGRPLEAAEIEAAVRQHEKRFGACLRQHFDPKTQPEGTLLVNFKILQDGSVAKTWIRPDVYANSPMARCVEAVARKVRLRPHADAFIEIEFPFEVRIQPSGG